MGICASFPELHVDAFDHENAVYFSGISTNSSQRIGSTYSHTGSRGGGNQDYAILFQNYGFEDGVFCGVFEAHGRNGHIVSKSVRNKLPSLLLTHTTKNDEKLENDQSKNFLKWKEGCTTAFRAMDREIKLLDKLDGGTTALLAVRQGEDLVIANLGNSRAVVGTRTEKGIVAVQLTSTDLMPEVPCEAERVRKNNVRVFDSPGLAAQSRAFGLKGRGIICDPDVSYHNLSSNHEFLVLATDGVWNVLSNEEVVSMVSKTRNEEAAAEAVVDAAITSWKYKFPNSKRDDCTVICLFLQKSCRRSASLSDQNLIKRWRSGVLFAGYFGGLFRNAAIKRIETKAFNSKMDLLSKISSHPRFECSQGDKKLKFIVNDDSLSPMDWIRRLKIARGVAEALAFLHHQCHPPLVHGDIRASSILVDDDYEVRLGSLGRVSRATRRHIVGFPGNASRVSTSGARRTCAYDVYCFGLVMLELVTGRLGISSRSVNDADCIRKWLDSALPHTKESSKEVLTTIVDPSLIIDEDLFEEVWAMALLATSCLTSNPNTWLL